MARVTITIEGLDAAISRLSGMEEKGAQNLQKQTELVAKDSEQAWKEATPVRSGRLRNADKAEIGLLQFTLNNATRYYGWLNDGHMTPMGWHRHGRYVPAKRRSRVAGRHMTEKAVDFIVQNLAKYLSRFLDGA